MKYLALCAAVLVCGCGDNFVPLCGERTAEVDGECVPTMEVCGDGTVLFDGVCRDPATVVPNATEEAEPNDVPGAGEIIVPGIGEPGFVAYGCISPRDNGETPDIDVWTVNVTQPTVLEIAADGVGGLAAGFIVASGPENPALSMFSRIGWNMNSDTAKRQVYLPVAGKYVIAMLDQRSIFFPGPAGSETTCYYTTFTHVALPAPKPLTLPTQEGTAHGDVQVFRYTSDADAGILRVHLTSESYQMASAWVAVRDGTFEGLAVDAASSGRWGAGYFVTAVDQGKFVDVVVDMSLNNALTPQPFTLDAYSIPAEPLPLAGGSVTVTMRSHAYGNEEMLYNVPIRSFNLYYFDVAPTTAIVQLDMTASQAAEVAVVNPNLNTGFFSPLADQDQGGGPLSFEKKLLRYAKPGRYYVGLYQPDGVEGETYTMTSTLTPQSAPAVTAGDTKTAQPILQTTGSAWLTLDANTPWVQMSAGGANLGGNLVATYYRLDKDGWIDSFSLPAEPELAQQFLENGTTVAGARVLRQPYLVRLRSAAGPMANQTFDYAVASTSPDELMQITEASPATRANVTVAAGQRKRFLVRSKSSVTIETTNGTFDAAIHLIRTTDVPVRTANAVTGIGNEKMLNTRALAGFATFEIENLGGAAGTIDVTASTLEAKPYEEICPGFYGGSGSLVTFGGSTPQVSLGFSLSFYGATVEHFRISEEGWLSFDPTASESAYTSIPNVAPPNMMIAGFWSSMDTTLCMKRYPDRTIVEWLGRDWQSYDVAAQVSIYKTGKRIEWAYSGTGHKANGQSASAGVENHDGTAGFQLFASEASGAYPGLAEAFILP